MPPNGQGLIVLMTLRFLEGYDIGGIFRNDLAAAEHLILEALKLSFADAERYIGDPRFGEVDVEQLLSNNFIASRRGKIRMDEAVSTPAAGQLRGDTTYFTVVYKIATLSHSLQAFRTSSVRVSWSVTQASLCTTEPRNFR